jgi:hypothetical protein
VSLFLDLRTADVGGPLARTVAIGQGTNRGNYQSATLADLTGAIHGRHVLVGTHGFNVDRSNGIESLANWAGLLHLPPPAAFVGVLWPGDSIWLHGLDYPEEPAVANQAGALLAPFIDSTFAGAASISFVSHSLGARVVLETVSLLVRPVRRVILMAGAIDDDCLTHEFADAAAKVGQISVLASHEDAVLALAFPLGNFLGGILTVHHPWWHGALGRTGPVQPVPANFQGPFEIPDGWSYGHGDYLRVEGPPPAGVAMPSDVPPQAQPVPANGVKGWKEGWSAALVSTRFG